MLQQIVICLPLALLLLGVLFIAGGLFNNVFNLYRIQPGGSYISFVGYCTLGFILLAVIYAAVVSHGKTLLLGIPLLICAHKLIYKGENYKFNLKEDLSAFSGYRIFLVVAAVVIISYLFILAQHYPAFETGYPLTFFDYHYYAQVSKELGLNGIENQKSMFTSYGFGCGTLLYHYSDLWLVDLISRVTMLNRLIVLMFVIYPLMLSLLIFGIIGLIRFIMPGVKPWQILLLIGAVLGVNLYLDRYAGVVLLNNFGLKCFPGMFHSHKLSIIYVFIFCSLFQFVQGDARRTVLWLSFLCLIYPTAIPAIVAGTLLTIIVLYCFKRIDLKFALSLVLFMAITIGFILTFDHLFSDHPRQAAKLDLLSHVKLITILSGTYLLKLAIVFFPICILLVVRFIYKVKLMLWEMVLWLFAFCSVAGAVAFASLNHGTWNASQAIYNIVPPVLIVISLISITILFQSGIPAFIKNGLFLMLIVIAGYNLVTDFNDASIYLKMENAYSRKYIGECLAEVNKAGENEKYINVVLVDSNQLLLWYYDFYQKGAFLFYSNKVTACLDISPFLPSGRKYPEYFADPEDYKNPIEKWFWENKVKTMMFDPPLLLKYFADFHIKYLDVSSGYKFSEEINRHLQLVSKDANTGEEFYKINL